MKLAEMRERINIVATEMSGLAQKDERSAEEDGKLDQLLREFNDLGPRLKREQEIQDAAREASGYSRGVAGIVPEAGAEEREREAKQADRRSLGQRFAESDQVKHVREQGGKRSQPVEVGSFYHRNQPTLQHVDSQQPHDVRALVQTGGLPASYIQPTYVPGFFRGDDLQGTLRSVLLNGQTNSDAITFYRETSFTNNAAAVAQATATTGTSGLKPESGMAFEEATVAVKTLAHWTPITRQVIWDTPQLQTYVEQRLLDGLRLVESAQLLNGDGTGANLLGILNTTGIQFLDNTATTGYWATNALSSAGQSNENFDRILRAKTLIRTVGRAVPNFVVLNPADLEIFLSSVDGQRQYYGAGPFSGAGIPNLWGLRVVEDENIAEGEALVGDGRMAAVWDRMQAQILIDTIDDQFVRNMLTILAEERLALAVYRPAAFAYVELA